VQASVFQAGMKRLTAMFGQLPEETAALYWSALRDLADGAFGLGVTEALKRCRFFPKPAEIREFASMWRPARQVQQQASASARIEEFSGTQVTEAKAWLERLISQVSERVTPHA